MITVIYKKGDVTNPENHRPFCGLPQHYTLFTTMFCSRLYAELDRYQCPDQAGFRKHSKQRTTLRRTELISQKSREWGTDMWVAAIEVKKAFDSIQLAGIWSSLRNHSISQQYICLLRKLFIDQRAAELTDVESDEFGTARRTKQGDRLSCLLLSSVLQSAMEKDTETEKEMGLGIKLSDEKEKTVFSNLRFTGDVLMMASSLKQLKNKPRISKNGVRKRMVLKSTQARPKS